MTLNEALNILKENGYNVELIDEDFSIGVGSPCGIDQGIPNSGDCKGVAPCRLGRLWQRLPSHGNPFDNNVIDAHHPDYWLKQISKKKKKNKKKHKVYIEK